MICTILESMARRSVALEQAARRITCVLVCCRG